MDERFNKIDGTSPVLDPFNSPAPQVPRSRFNFSNVQITQALIGALHPLQPIETVPNEDYKINVNMMIQVRTPLNRKLLSGMRAYIHFRYLRVSDVWEGADMFYSGGRKGVTNMKLPELRCTYKNRSGAPYNVLTPLCPADTMGIHPSFYLPSSNLRMFQPVITARPDLKVYRSQSETDNLKISAIPFAMYEKMCIDNYYNKNLLQNDSILYPDNPDDLILPFSLQTKVSTLSRSNPYQAQDRFLGTDTPENYFDAINVPTGDGLHSDVPHCLNSLHFRQWKGDYFTTLSPFEDLLRGNIPTLNFSDIVGALDFSDVVKSFDGSDLSNANVLLQFDRDSHHQSLTINGTQSGSYDDWTRLKTAFERVKISDNISVSLKNLRELEAYTLFKERNARTDGDYNSLIKAQFGYNPHSDSHKDIYIGGMYQDLIFSEVTQTSASTTSGTPLGTSAGRAISAGNGFIGSFHSPDYGFIIPILSIVPDVYYTNNLPKMFSKLTQQEIYSPLFNNLSAQAVLKGEINATGKDFDNKLLGWAERFSELKSRPNIVTGLSRLPKNDALYDTNLVLARRFGNSEYSLNNRNNTMFVDNVDYSIFSSSNEPPFDVVIQSIVDKVSPMPYVTVPGGLSARA